MIAGELTTNLDFHRWMMNHPRFLGGDFDTNFIAQEYHPESARRRRTEIRTPTNSRRDAGGRGAAQNLGNGRGTRAAGSGAARRAAVGRGRRSAGSTC